MTGWKGKETGDVEDGLTGHGTREGASAQDS